jgi:hypothetical protein
MTGRPSMLPSSNFFDGRDVMDLGKVPPQKPQVVRRRTDVSTGPCEGGSTNLTCGKEPSKRVEDYQHWMALIWKDGKLVVRSSPDMRPYKNMVLRPEAEKKFLYVIADHVGRFGMVPSSCAC